MAQSLIPHWSAGVAALVHRCILGQAPLVPPDDLLKQGQATLRGFEARRTGRQCGQEAVAPAQEPDGSIFWQAVQDHFPSRGLAKPGLRQLAVTRRQVGGFRRSQDHQTALGAEQPLQRQR